MSSTNNWRSMAGLTFECAKQEAIGSRGMVSTNHPLASVAGAEMLARGGNAVDAAIASAFALTVVEPMMVGIFAGGFLLYYEAATGQVTAIDNYAIAPKAASPDMYEPDDAAGPMEAVDLTNRVGYLSVGTPGALKAWCHALEKHGTMDLAEVMAPAIRYAEGGFKASPYLCYWINEEREHIARFPATAEILLPGGGPIKPGEMLTQKDAGKSLRLIAEGGADVLYNGSLGEAVAEDMAKNGGLLTMDDLSSYELRFRDPVRGSYRGHEIVSMGPTSSGGVHIIQALNLLEGFDLRGIGYGTTEYFHLLLEVLRLCWADRFEYLGDPEVVDVPVDELISKGYSDSRRSELGLEHAGNYSYGDLRIPSSESRNTTHFTVADADGNVVTATQTINEAFGSRVVVPGTGLFLNDCMSLFDPHPGRPNSVGPGKRMLSSMSPTIVFKDEKPWFALGTPGGTRIFAAVLQAILNMIDHGMTFQEAMEAPRVWTQGDEIEVEEGVPQPIRDALDSRGHTVQVVPTVADGMNGIMYDRESGLIRGAACWRADGVALGISGGPAVIPDSMKS